MKVQLVGVTTLVILVFGLIIGSIFGVFNGILAIVLSILVGTLLRSKFRKTEQESLDTEQAQPQFNA